MDIEVSKPKKKRHHAGSQGFEGAFIEDLRINGRVWVGKEGATYLAWGRVVLLERIDKCGSISAAARSMGISYRHAWLLVEQMNKLAPTPLVVAQKGGQKGGGTTLTPDGKKALQGFWLLVQKFEAFLNEASRDDRLKNLLLPVQQP